MPDDDLGSVIPIESDADVVTARQRARQMAGDLELTSTYQTLLATAISEVARNITTYATRVEVLLSIVRDEAAREGIQVIARDEGPGIENVELALQDGYTSGGGLGLAVPKMPASGRPFGTRGVGAGASRPAAATILEAVDSFGPERTAGAGIGPDTRGGGSRW